MLAPETKISTGYKRAIATLTSASIIALGVAIGSANAAIIDATGSDPGGSSSFGTPSVWAAEASAPAVGAGDAPVAGHSYRANVGNTIRTPTTGALNTFAGDSLILNGGFLALKGVTGSTVSANLVLIGGTVLNANSANTQTLAGTIDVQSTSLLRSRAGSPTAKTLIVTSSMTGAGGIQIDTENSTGSVTFFGPAKDYQGDTEILDDSILVLNGLNMLPSDPSDGNLVIGLNSEVQIGGNNTTIQGLSGNGDVTTTGATLTIQGGSTTQTFDGDMTGALNVVKSGTANQNIATAQSYTGTTTISGGTYGISDAGALGTGSSTTIDGTGTLGLSGTIDVTETLNLTGRTTSEAHVQNTADTNKVSGTVNLDSGGPNNEFRFSSTGGTLNLNTAVTDNSTDNDDLVLDGTATGKVNAAINLTGTGTDRVVKDGTGTWTTSGISADQVQVNNGTLTLGATTTIAGAAASTSIDVQSGTLNQTGAFINRTDQSGGLNVDGTLDLSGQDASASFIDGSGTIDQTGMAATHTLTVGNSDGNDGSFSGTIQDTSGTLNLVKDGNNTQSAGTVNIAGTVDVDDGTLTVTSLTSGDVGVDSGATLNATGATVGNVTVDGTANIDTITSSTSITAQGSGSLTVTGTTSTAGTIAVSGDATVDLQGDATASGVTVNAGPSESASLELSGNNNLGGIDINGGTVTAQSNGALGGGGATVGGVNGVLNLETNVSIADQIVLEGIAGTTTQLNGTGNNTITSGPVTMNVGTGNNFVVESDSGAFGIFGFSGGTGGTDNLILRGASTDVGNTVGSINFAAGTNTLTKAGTGNWELTGPLTNIETVAVTDGTLSVNGVGITSTVGDNFVVSDSATLQTLSDGNSDLTSGQTLEGAGALLGEFFTDAGSAIAPGIGAGDIDELFFTNDLTIQGTLEIEIASTGLADSIDVGGSLDIASATLDIDVLTSLTDDKLIYIATYDTLTGPFGSIIGNLPSFYTIDYNYKGTKQIALVGDNFVEPVPAPTGVALLSLGLLSLAGLRRRKDKRSTI